MVMTKISKQWDFDSTLSFPVGLSCLFPSVISSSSPGRLVRISMAVVTTQKVRNCDCRVASSNPQAWENMSVECKRIRSNSN